MVRSYVTSAFASALLLGFATAALAVTGEYGNMCTMGLASRKDIQTDCSINAQLQGKTYCFGSKEAMTQFMADPSGNLAKAQATTQRSIPVKLGASLEPGKGPPPICGGLCASRVRNQFGPRQSNRNVRSWHKADSRQDQGIRPLLTPEQTCHPRLARLGPSSFLPSCVLSVLS